MSTNNEELLIEIMKIADRQTELEKKLDRVVRLLEEIKAGKEG